MTKKKYHINLSDFKTLKEMGYTVYKFEFWHYRIGKEGEELVLDIFPTTRTFCRKLGDHISKGNIYIDLINLVETELDSFARRFKK